MIARKDIPHNVEDFFRRYRANFRIKRKTHREILFMKNLHAKHEVTCKWPTYEWPLSKWIIPEMTFPEYMCRMQQNFEAANGMIKLKWSSSE